MRFWNHLPRCSFHLGDGPSYRDALIDCGVIPALLARLTPDAPVSFFWTSHASEIAIVNKHAESKHECIAGGIPSQPYMDPIEPL